jgi:hypothetical protein
MAAHLALNEKEVATYVDAQRIPLRLSCHTPSGWPVVLSLWFIRLEDSLWCATQEGARVIAYLRSEPRCGFEVAGETPPYRGVRGRAVARLHKDRASEILRLLLERYQGSLETPLARRLLAKVATEIAIELQPRSLHSWDFTKRMSQ